MFNEFLLSLGWPVDVDSHAGWTGNVQTSWRINSASDKNDQSEELPPVTSGLYFFYLIFAVV